MLNEQLHRGFSFGTSIQDYSVLESITPEVKIRHPSIAYKEFSFEFVDFIWMDGEYPEYKILYFRDEKLTGLNIEDNESDKGFSITGFPNPFSDILDIRVNVFSGNDEPIIQIYDPDSRLIKVLSSVSNSNFTFEYSWNGTNNSGEQVSDGLYIISCTIGQRKTARKVVYQH